MSRGRLSVVVEVDRKKLEEFEAGDLARKEVEEVSAI